MILERTWNKKDKKLVISYVDKNGNKQFYTKFFSYFRTYEYDDNGEYDTWNGHKCRKVFKDTTNYTPNEFDILEFLYELPKEFNEELHAQYFPKLYFFDIETEISSEFPDPELAKQMVTSISLVGPDLSCIVYGLKFMSDAQKDKLKERYLNWINENEFARNLIKDKKQPKVLYQMFKSEEEMLKHFYTVILPKVPAIAGWNSYNFDFRYLWNRIVNLFGKGEAYNILRKASPVGEITNLSYKDVDGKRYVVNMTGAVSVNDKPATAVDYSHMNMSKKQAERMGLTLSDWSKKYATDWSDCKYDDQDYFKKNNLYFTSYEAMKVALPAIIAKANNEGKPIVSVEFPQNDIGDAMAKEADNKLFAGGEMNDVIKKANLLTPYPVQANVSYGANKNFFGFMISSSHVPKA